MNKATLTAIVANAADIPVAKANIVIGAFLDSVIAALAKGEPVQLVGFGTFSRGLRAERTGHHPRTGKPIQIKRANTVRFVAGKAFKEAVNQA